MRILFQLVLFFGLFVLTSCGGGSGAVTYTLGGTVTGLTSGTLVVKNNSGDALTVATNSTSFTFSTPLAGSNAYAATVYTQPIGLFCSLSNSSGTVATSNITNITVSCVNNLATFNTVGSATFTVPTGVTSLQIVGIGGGGAGGQTYSGPSDYSTSSLGGNGGVVTYTLSVTPGQIFNLNIGSGGSPNTNIPNFAGGSGGGLTSVDLGTTNLIVAGGGGGGGGAAFGSFGGNGGNGGSNQLNTTNYAGATGSNGDLGSNSNLFYSFGYGGAGGSSGTGGSGGNAGVIHGPNGPLSGTAGGSSNAGAGGTDGGFVCGGQGGYGNGGGGGGGGGDAGGGCGGGGGGGSYGQNGSIFSTSTNSGGGYASGGNGRVLITLIP
jgi:hypothetical protein